MKGRMMNSSSSSRSCKPRLQAMRRTLAEMGWTGWGGVGLFSSCAARFWGGLPREVHRTPVYESAILAAKQASTTPRTSNSTPDDDGLSASLIDHSCALFAMASDSLVGPASDREALGFSP